jgi:DNA-3-methyladenine glycosylase II
VRGIGEWTAQCYLMACLKRLDGWPSSDLGLIVAIQRLNGLEDRPDYLTIEKMSEPWSPYRTLAALILWSTYDKE